MWSIAEEITQMSESPNEAEEAHRETPLLRHIAPFQQREYQIFLLLTLAIGALTGLAVVAFIVLTERLGMRTWIGSSGQALVDKRLRCDERHPNPE
jgi:hypothetical protein